MEGDREVPEMDEMEEDQESNSKQSGKRVEWENIIEERTSAKASPVRKKQRPPRLRKGHDKGQDQPRNTIMTSEGF